MPLSLTIPLHGSVHIGDRKLEIVSTSLLVRARLDDGAEFDLSGHTIAEILPGIRVGLDLVRLQQPVDGGQPVQDPDPGLDVARIAPEPQLQI